VAPFYGDILNKRATKADKGDIFGLVPEGPTASEDSSDQLREHTNLGITLGSRWEYARSMIVFPARVVSGPLLLASLPGTTPAIRRTSWH
jgi:hypothetical protein